MEVLLQVDLEVQVVVVADLAHLVLLVVMQNQVKVTLEEMLLQQAQMIHQVQVEVVQVQLDQMQPQVQDQTLVYQAVLVVQD
jgi:hypothetical protein